VFTLTKTYKNAVLIKGDILQSKIFKQFEIVHQGNQQSIEEELKKEKIAENSVEQQEEVIDEQVRE